MESLEIFVLLGKTISNPSTYLFPSGMMRAKFHLCTPVPPGTAWVDMASWFAAPATWDRILIKKSKVYQGQGVYDFYVLVIEMWNLVTKSALVQGF